MKLMLGLSAGLISAVFAGGAMAQTTTLPGGGTTTIPGTSASTVVTRPDGTRIETTILGPTSLRISITGGPDYTSAPATVNFTNIVTSGTTQTYTGDVSRGGVTVAFSCTVNATTREITGSGACADALGGSSTTAPTTPPPTTTPTTPTPPTPAPPTTPTTPTTPTPTPAEPTMVAPDGTTITIAAGNLLLLTAVQTDQFLNSLLGDALSSSFGQAFVAARMQVLSAGGSYGGMAANRGYRGLSAGEGDGPIGVWINAQGVRIKDDRVGRDQKGWSKSVAMGADYLVSSSAVLGVFAAYGDTDLDGPSAGYEADGWTGGVYGSFVVGAGISVTGLVGYNAQDLSNTRTFGILSSRGDTDREQVFGSLTVEGQFEVAPNWLLAPAASVFLSDSKTDGYRDSAGRAIARVDNKLSILRTGASLFYRAGAISPYVSAGWDHYLDDEFLADGDYGRIGAGVSVTLSPASYLSVGASTTVGKKDERETTFGVTLGGRF